MDDLGGIDLAVQKARQLAGIPSASHVSLVLYPAKKSLWEFIMQAANGDSADAMLSHLSLEPLRVALRDSRIRVWLRGGMMRMMPFSMEFK